MELKTRQCMSKAIMVLLFATLSASAQFVPSSGGGSSITAGGTNGIVYQLSNGTFQATATGGAGTLCLISASGGTPVFGSCAGSASTVWSALTNPAGNLSLNVGTNTTLWTVQGNTSTSNMFSIIDTTGNTGTGSLLEVNTVGTSAAHPITITAQGVANGVQMSTAGALAAIGTGAIAANTVTGFSPTASKVLTLSNSMTQTATDGSTVAFGTGGTVTYTTNNLSVFAATTSAQLAGVISDETGTGALVFGTAPTITLANGTGLPVSTGISGFGTGIATFLATPSSANLAAAITDETGTGLAVFGTSPTIVTPTIASFANANHNHTNSAGGGQLNITTASNATGTPSSSTFLRGDNTWSVASGGSGCTASGAAGVVQASNGSGGCQATSATDNGTTFAVTEPFTSTGTITSGSGSGVAGQTAYGQGTAPTVTANTWGWQAPTTITTSWVGQSPNAVPAANQIMLFPAPTSNVSAWAWTNFTLTGMSSTFSSPLSLTANTVTCPTCGVTGSPLSQFAATTSAQLAGVISDETGTGALVFGTAPTITLANGTGLPISTGVSGLGTGCATWLGTPSSANLATCLTDETGSGAAVFATSPTLVTPTLGVAVATSLGVGTSPPACTSGTAGGICFTEGTALTNVASSGALDANSTTHELEYQSNGSALKGMLVRAQPGAIRSTGLVASVSTATLCAASAGACNTSGQYHIHWVFYESGTACGTPATGGVTFLLTWTDGNGTTHSAVSLGMDDASAINAVSQTFHFQTTLAAAWGSGDFNIDTNGSVIQYATGYTACGVGTGTYALSAAVTRVQ